MVYTADLKSAAFGLEGSNPSSRTNYAPLDKLVKSSLSKGEVLSVRIRGGVPNYLPVAQLDRAFAF